MRPLEVVFKRVRGSSVEELFAAEENVEDWKEEYFERQAEEGT